MFPWDHFLFALWCSQQLVCGHFLKRIFFLALEKKKFITRHIFLNLTSLIKSMNMSKARAPSEVEAPSWYCEVVDNSFLADYYSTVFFFLIRTLTVATPTHKFIKTSSKMSQFFKNYKYSDIIKPTSALRMYVITASVTVPYRRKIHYLLKSNQLLCFVTLRSYELYKRSRGQLLQYIWLVCWSSGKPWLLYWKLLVRFLASTNVWWVCLVVVARGFVRVQL